MCDLKEKIGSGGNGEIYIDDDDYVTKIVNSELSMSEINILFNFKSKYLNSAVAMYDKEECNGKYAFKLNKCSASIIIYL